MTDRWRMIALAGLVALSWALLLVLEGHRAPPCPPAGPPPDPAALLRGAEDYPWPGLDAGDGGGRDR